MKKFITVVKVILILLLVFVLVGFVILYCVNKTQAQEIIDRVGEYCEKPLPIVGVSLGVVVSADFRFRGI